MRLTDLDLNKLATFLAVVDCGGVGKAGTRLGRTSSAISQSVSALEASLDCRLFDRVGKRLVLTRPGQLLHDRLREYQAGLARTVSDLANQDGEVNGLVRVGLFLGFPRNRFTRLATRFAQTFPKASLRVVFAPQEDLEERLRKNRLDFVFSFRPRRAESTDIQSTQLFSEELVLVTTKKFFTEGLSLRALAATPIVDYYQSDPLIVRWLTHHYPRTDVEVNVRFWAATTDLVLDLVSSGAGAGVLPRGIAHTALESRRLELLSPKKPPLVDHIWLNEPKDAYRDRSLLAFKDVVLSELVRERTASNPAK